MLPAQAARVAGFEDYRPFVGVLVVDPPDAAPTPDERIILMTQ